MSSANSSMSSSPAMPGREDLDVDESVRLGLRLDLGDGDLAVLRLRDDHEVEQSHDPRADQVEQCTHDPR